MITTPTQQQSTFTIRSIRLPLAAIVLGTFMAVLDQTAVNVALPALEHAFGTDLRLMQWTITGYVLAQAAVIPLSGWLGDRFGMKRVYLVAVALFTLGSVLCAAAPSGPMLVLFRVLQGLGGGMLMPLGMAFTYRLAPPEQRGTVMALFGVPVLVAPALGPVLSGYLIQYADWRAIFLLNLPVGIAALVLGLRALPALPADRAAGTLDLPGALLGPLAVTALIYGISQSTTDSWTGAATLGGITLGGIALAVFVARELTATNPLLELRVFRHRDFSLAVVTQWAIGAALFGSLFLLPLFLQQVRGYGSLATGLYIVAQPIGAALFMPISGRIFDRFGARPTVGAGAILVTSSFVALTRVSATTSGRDLLVPLFLWGAGLGLSLMPLNTQVLSMAPRDLVTRVTSLSGALQNVVVSLAVAGYATILQGRMSVHLGAVRAGAEHHAGNPVQGALAASFDDVFVVAAAVAGIAVLLALMLRRVPVADGPATVSSTGMTTRTRQRAAPALEARSSSAMGAAADASHDDVPAGVLHESHGNGRAPFQPAATDC